MAAPYTPNTDIWLINAPLTRGDGRQIDFATAAAQATYFTVTCPHYAVSDCTYQRREAVIRVPLLYDLCRQYNYIAYENSAGPGVGAFTPKMIYAYITGMEYVNDECTAIRFEVDYFQTWLFQMQLRPCLVIREHTATDGAYEHTVPENLEVGTPIEIYRHMATPVALNSENTTAFDDNFRIMFVFTQEIQQLAQTTDPYPQKFIGGMPAGVYYYGVDRADAKTVIDIINTNGLADAVVCAYIVPKNALTWSVWNTSPGVYLPSDKSLNDITITPPKGWTIPIGQGAYTFKNRKCLCYPYHFYRLVTFGGKSVDLKTELFSAVSGAGNMVFSSVFSGQVNPQLLVMPRNYAYTGYGDTDALASGRNFSYAVEYTDFAQIPTTSDVYKNYAALNASKIGLEKLENYGAIAKGLFSAASSPELTAGASDISGGIYGLVKMQAGFADMQRIPDKIQGTPTGSTLQQARGAGVFLCEMMCKDEYMDQVDQFFTMFGYKVNCLKTPQFNSRPHWNYIQTANADVGGSIPADDAEQIQAILNAGLTVWHVPAEFGTYTADNRVSI